MCKKLKEEDVMKWFLEHNSKLIKFIRRDEKIYYVCSKCGGDAEYLNFSMLRRRNSNCLCRKCIMLGFSEKRKLPINLVKQWFLERNSELMSEYRGIDSEFLYRCVKCGEGVKGYSFYNFRRRDSKCWCRRCINISNLRDGSPNWNPNKTDEERKKDRHSLSGYKIWVQKVLRRDNYLCQISEEKNNLTIHHLYSWGDFPEKRFLIENGVTVTKEVHIDFHMRYGYGKNTPDQFREFMESYNGS